ncbi:MAG: acyl-CoA thioesterase [bacterium]|nr:acyl-CoA thioesterase [bacterium]
MAFTRESAGCLNEWLPAFFVLLLACILIAPGNPLRSLGPMGFTIPIQIRFRDTDGMGHVNNAAFLSYCEVARLEFYRSHYTVRGPRDVPFILARTEIDYLRPLGLDQPSVEVAMTVPRIGESSWDFAYEIRPTGTADANASFARAKTVLVAYDYERGAKQPIDAKFRKILSDLQT